MYADFLLFENSHYIKLIYTHPNLLPQHLYIQGTRYKVLFLVNLCSLLKYKYLYVELQGHILPFLSMVIPLLNLLPCLFFPNNLWPLITTLQSWKSSHQHLLMATHDGF